MIELRGGKTAPRLLDDLSSYDPRRPTVTGFNHLIDLPRQYENGNTPRIPRTKNYCQHKWAVKDSQCNLPLIIGRPDPKIVSTVAAFCEHCRCHLDLSIDFRGGGTSQCPSEEAPLHHFRYQPQISSPRYRGDNGPKADNPNDWEDLTWFQCSSIDCSARLRIRIRSPRLRPEWVEMLTDKNLIKSRAEKAISDDPSRFEGVAVPLPCEVLSNLRTYIINAPTRRSLQANNKRWLLCLGDACSELLDYMGFKREEDVWLVPQPDVSQSLPISNPVNILLDDVEKELAALLLQRPDDERRAIKVQYGLSTATRDLSRALGTANYKEKPSARTETSQDPEHPYYPTLGAKVDFHDDLIKFSYKRQLVADPDNLPYYLESLQGIAEGRKSEELQTLVAIEASSGKVSANDVRKAYKLLDLDIGSAFLDDDGIIGSFQARAADAPRQEPELRRALQIVGQDRSSQKIQFVASKTVTNYEQALSWLNATADMSDEFVVSMYSVKVDENQAEEASARQAVSLIAQQRKSAALKQWLETGVLGEFEMDVGQAYNRLQIDDHTISDDFVLTAFQLFHQESPSQADDLRSALRAIAKDRNSQTLLNFLDSGMATSEYPLGEWPVGLANIGNTCYLNSLLQFYFTVKPLRELVLNFDQHKMELTAENLVKKVVGSRRISRQEVQRAQSFVYRLRTLFQSMITSNRAHVSPELELARLTLVTQPLEAALRRRSTTTGNRPSLGEINGRPVIGPLPPPIAEVANDDVYASERPAENQVNGVLGNGGTDNSSEETLLGNDPAEEADQKLIDPNSVELQQQQQQILEDKENLPPTKAASERPTTPEYTLKPLAESSPSRMNEQHPSVEGNHFLANSESAPKPEYPVISSPPSRPPPFPPRPEAEDQKQAMVEEVQLGAQQDVTEVISNVLFQLECAIEADDFDPSGEQLDLVKQLFFGKQRSYTSNPQGVLRTKEQFFSNIIVDVASGPKDLYEALDGAFDEQEVEVEGTLRPQYTTITRLPPVLKVMVQRVQYDQKKASAFKSVNHLGLKDTIYMDRYVDSEDDDLIRRRNQSWDWKRQLRKLEARRNDLTKTELEMEAPEVLSAAKEYLDQLSEDDAFEVPTSLREAIEEAAAHSKIELASINARIKDLTANISSQFVDMRNLPYRLQSVFIHVGSATFGHYWIYIRDFEKNMWRKYNDESVSVVTDVSDIFDQDPGDRPPTPYFLVYVKDDLKHVLVDPVCRDIPPQGQAREASPEQQALDASDTVMDDVTAVDAERPSARGGDGQGMMTATGDWYKGESKREQVAW